MEKTWGHVWINGRFNGNTTIFDGKLMEHHLKMGNSRDLIKKSSKIWKLTN
jgi:hypothetical protein